MSRARAAEAAAVAAAGAVLGGAAGGVVGWTVPAAIVGAANGALSGWRGIYDWRSSTGRVAFALDSSWSIANTFAGLVSHVAGAARGRSGYVAALSVRCNRHVYRRGLQLRRGFALTLGNVVSGAGDVGRPRRVRLVTDHEDVHVWQARWFGPAYPVLYLGWMVGGAVAGVLSRVVSSRGDPLPRVVESYAYYLNPFEWWAYSRDDHWPPAGLLDGVGWRRPAIRSFAASAEG